MHELTLIGVFFSCLKPALCQKFRHFVNSSILNHICYKNLCGKPFTAEVFNSVARSLVEYFGSPFQKIVFGSTSWDYSSHFMNIGGRVSLQMALIWSVLGIAFTRFVFPTLVRLLSTMKNKFWRIGCIVLSIFMAVNLLLSAAEVIWWRGQITGNISPANAFEQLFDKTYDNEAMEKNYPNMKFSGQEA